MVGSVCLVLDRSSGGLLQWCDIGREKFKVEARQNCRDRKEDGGVCYLDIEAAHILNRVTDWTSTSTKPKLKPKPLLCLILNAGMCVCMCVCVR